MKKPGWFNNPWPVGLIIFFIIFISYIAGFIAFASRQRMDLVRADYYDQEISFQKQIDRMKRTAPMMANATMAYDPQTETVTVTLPSTIAAADVSGTIGFYRPSDAGMDHDVTLKPNAAGTQSVNVRGFAAGLWKVRVQWTTRGQDYYFERPLKIAPEHS